MEDQEAERKKIEEKRLAKIAEDKRLSSILNSSLNIGEGGGGSV